MDILEGKRILFIAPVFHDYHHLVIRKIEELGAHVNFFPERDYSIIFKVFNNFSSSFLKNYQKFHYDKISKKFISDEYDYLFVIRGYLMPIEFIERFKSKNPKAVLIMYQWDSNETNPFSHLLEYFNVCYSFDFQDCSTFKRLQYLPLFYTDDILPFVNSKEYPDYDFFFMGWFFPERYQAVLKFKQFALNNNYTIKAFLFMPFTSYVKAILKRTSIDRSIVSFKPMKRKQYLEILSKSRVMVDVSNPNQTGLAMRVVEALATNTKVLTNNYRLTEDSNIYNKAAVAFFDDHNPQLSNDFLDNNRIYTNSSVRSIEEWLKLIFAKS